MLHAHLVGAVGVDIVSAQNALVEDRTRLCSYALVVEIAGTNRSCLMWLITQHEFLAHHLLSDLVEQEGVLLLDG